MKPWDARNDCGSHREQVINNLSPPRGKSRPPMFAFVDETGNTGENLFDKKQPTLLRLR
jgi:hypothetical protein